MSTQAYGDRGTGWLEFAAIILFSVGVFRIISAISYFADSHRINNFTGGLFGDQIWVWGIWDLAIAATALYAGYSLIRGGVLGRVVGYIWGALVIVQGFTVMNLAPWYGAAAIALGVLVIYGIARSPRTAALP